MQAYSQHFVCGGAPEFWRGTVGGATSLAPEHWGPTSVGGPWPSVGGPAGGPAGPPGPIAGYDPAARNATQLLV